MPSTITPDVTYTASGWPFTAGNEVETYRFEQTTVQIERGQNGAPISVRVQCIDAYRRQRELSIGRVRTPGAPMGEASSYYWRVSAYVHPFHRKLSGGWDEVRVSRGVAQRLLERFTEITTRYPSLLFSPTSDRGARCDGFVLWHDALVNGAVPSCDQL